MSRLSTLSEWSMLSYDAVQPGERMTLSVRNNYFKGGIILTALSLGLTAAGGYYAFSALPDALTSASKRSSEMLPGLAGIIERFSEASATVPFWTILGAVAYSFIGIILIFYFFEKTSSPEILFIGFFVISLSLEFTRIAIPLIRVIPFPSIYLITASKVLIFGRYFGLFSLFAAGVHAAGMEIQKQQTIFFLTLLSALIIVWNIPVDNVEWDSTFVFSYGYSSMFHIVEAGILIITVVTFIISAYTRSSRTYIHIGVGILLVFTGRNILLNSDTWITPIPGFLLLSAGTWFICSRLRRMYLWL